MDYFLVVALLWGIPLVCCNEKISGSSRAGFVAVIAVVAVVVILLGALLS